MYHYRLQALLEQRRHGFSLPRDFYIDEDVFLLDRDAVFAADWLFHTTYARYQKLKIALSFK